MADEKKIGTYAPGSFDGAENDSQYLLVVKNLKKYFNINTGMFSSKPLKAVDDVSFSIQRGETLGLVGESGCGKTTVGRTLLHLYKPTGGEIWFDEKKIETKRDILEYRKRSAIRQTPYRNRLRRCQRRFYFRNL